MPLIQPKEILFKKPYAQNIHYNMIITKKFEKINKNEAAPKLQNMDLPEYFS